MTKDFILHKKNEVYLTIECTDSLAYELSEYFTFFVPGYTFMPSYQARRWDGKKRLFNIRSHLLFCGLVGKFKDFCSERSYTYGFNYEHDTIEFSLDEAKSFIQSLNLPDKIEIRPYQIESFCKAIRNNGGLLLSPTGSGKTLIIYLIVRYLEKSKKRGLFIVPRIQLTRQLKSDFEFYSINNGWNVDKFLQLIYYGQSKEITSYLTVGTWQSVVKEEKDWFQQFDFILGDEAHEFESKSLDYIMTNTINASFRYGQTGSLKGTKCHAWVLEGLFNPLYQETTTEELINQNYLSQLEIKCLLLKHSESNCKEAKNLKYPQELELIFGNKARNNFIANLAISVNGNTLVLFQYIEKHGDILSKLIFDKLDKSKSTRKVFYVYGKTEVEIREEVRLIVSSEKDAIIIASVGTFAMGIDIPSLTNLILAAPFKSRVRVLQSIGRILRLSEGKTMATVFDIADDLRYNKKENITLKHFAERIKIYTEQKFRFKIYNIKLKD